MNLHDFTILSSSYAEKMVKEALVSLNIYENNYTMINLYTPKLVPCFISTVCSCKQGYYGMEISFVWKVPAT